MAPLMRRAVRALARLLLAVALSVVPGAALADAGWFESGEVRLRTDLQLLNDAEIIRLPVNQWPLPRAAVQYALANAKEHFVTNAAVRAALQRVRGRAEKPDAWRFSTFVGGGGAGLLRDFD